MLDCWIVPSLLVQGVPSGSFLQNHYISNHFKHDFASEKWAITAKWIIILGTWRWSNMYPIKHLDIIIMAVQTCVNLGCGCGSNVWVTILSFILQCTIALVTEMTPHWGDVGRHYGNQSIIPSWQSFCYFPGVIPGWRTWSVLCMLMLL